MLAHHVTFRLRADRWIARTPKELRLLSTSLVALGGEGLLAFRVVDTHLHAIVEHDRAASGRFAWRVENSLRRSLRLAAPFDPARHRPIESFGHLRSALAYLFNQTAHHRAAFDPEHEGSSLPDTLGLRVLCPDFAARITAALPRADLTSFRRFLQVPPDLVYRRDLPEDAHPVEVLRAAEAALGVIATGRDPAAVQARRAVIALLPSHTALAESLGLHRRSVQRAHPPRPPVLLATLRQLHLRRALETRRATDEPSAVARDES